MTQRQKLYLAFFITITILVLTWFGHDLITLKQVHEHQLALRAFYISHPVETLTVFLFIYVVCAAFSIPGATILTLAAGAIFGFWVGLAVVCLASNIGAVIAFLISRFLLRDYFQKTLSNQLKSVNANIKRDGAFYLFLLRVVPIFPFFIVNAILGLTPISTQLFFFTSLLGMLPATALYINAGTHIADIQSASDLLSPNLILAFGLLGVFPLALKKLLKPAKH